MQAVTRRARRHHRRGAGPARARRRLDRPGRRPSPRRQRDQRLHPAATAHRRGRSGHRRPTTRTSTPAGSTTTDPSRRSLAVLAAVRASSLELLESLTPDEWARTGQHSDSGRYSVDDWLGIYARHPHDHAGQIRRARGWERHGGRCPAARCSSSRRAPGTPSSCCSTPAIVDSRAWDACVPVLTSAGLPGHPRTTGAASAGRRPRMCPISNRADAGRRPGCRSASSVRSWSATRRAARSRWTWPSSTRSGSRRWSAWPAVVGGYEPEPTPAEAELFDEMERLEASGDADAIAAFDVDGLGEWPGPAGRPRAGAHPRGRPRDGPRHLRPAARHGPADPPGAAARPAASAELTAPVLAVAGDLDVSDVWPTAEYLAAHAPDARAVLLPDVAHMIGHGGARRAGTPHRRVPGHDRRRTTGVTDHVT